MKKRSILFAVLLLVLALLCVGCGEKKAEPAEAAPVEQTSGDFRYILLKDGTAEITGYSGENKNMVIPKELDGHPVTSIGNEAFYIRFDLTDVTFPEGLTRIGERAFGSCDGLTSVEFPVGLTTIGNSAFYSCEKLVNVIFPEGLTSIGAGAFGNCERIKSITIPEGVTSIGNSAFAHCAGLKSVSFPQSLTSIGTDAFGSKQFHASDDPVDVKFTVVQGSWAESWCKENDENFSYSK